MILELFGGFIILLLLAYIVYLHIQLSRKNIFIESTVRRLSGIEKNRSLEEMISLLKEIQKLGLYTDSSTDKILEENYLNFIFENEKDVLTFIHYTRDVNDAKNILSTGFIFADSFYKTAIPVTRDKLNITIKHNSKKFFGDYLIIIGISKEIMRFYSMELKKAGINHLNYENVLTEEAPVLNENSDITYKLSHQFVKGYINYKTGEIVKNPDFDPFYDCDSFKKNINSIKTNSNH